MRKIYLDNNATTPINKLVAKALEKSNRYYYGNPSSPYNPGKASRLELEKAREETAKSMKENILFHCDAVQALGKVKIDVKDLDVDLLSISSHKIYGPKGVGALYIKKGIDIYPIFYGGHQEKSIRPGTENVYSIIGFGYACNLSRMNFDKNIELLAELKKYTTNRLLQEIKEITNIRINNPENNCLPNTLSVCFEV